VPEAALGRLPQAADERAAVQRVATGASVGAVRVVGASRAAAEDACRFRPALDATVGCRQARLTRTQRFGAANGQSASQVDAR
jgi:hypothetical protein